MEYDQFLDSQFKHLEINLVKHDTSFNGLPVYIEVKLPQMPKNKESTVLDLGNYIFRRFGLSYQMCPEYREKGKKTTLRWFMSWDDLKPIHLNILKHFKKEKMIRIERYLPFEFYSFNIQK